MHDLDAGSGEMREVVKRLGIAGAHQDDERRPVDDAAGGELAPAVLRDDSGFRELLRVELERKQRQVSRNPEDELIGHGARARKGADDLDLLSGACAPLTLELRKDSMVEGFAENAASVKDDRAPRTS